MTDQETPRDGYATGLVPLTGGVPLLALVMTGALRLREHDTEERGD